MKPLAQSAANCPRRTPGERCMRVGMWLLAACCAAGLPSRSASAKLRFAGEAPKVYTVQPRTHLFAHTLQLGLGVLPLDAFYVGLVVHGSYSYHFSDLWAWEILHVGYSFDFDTQLIDHLADFGAAVEVQQINRVRLLLGTHVQMTPLVGKVAVLNRAFVVAETHFLLGAGLLGIQGQNGVAGGSTTFAFAPAIDLGVGIDLFVSCALAARLDIRDAIAFGGAGVVNVMTLTLAGNFNFGAPLATRVAPGAT